MSLLLAFALASGQPAALPMLALDVSKPLGTPAVEEAAVRSAIADVYAVISGPAGQKRDWVRMRKLFTPDARLYAAGRSSLSGGSLEDYIAKAGPSLEKVGFTERELVGRVQMYGNVAQVWSSYHGTSTDGTVNVRGINSFQLVRESDGRWLVHSILWQAADPQLPLPKDMEAR
ncbi:nuclear transport factor 2 family protein [Sphingomonas kaistensis]|uniref:Nuclear transport factor 2 family protein n=1 Tax=Sphingomonas kaistensis TaxID=298708 RepID=A0ABZ2FZY2_9SPHN